MLSLAEQTIAGLRAFLDQRDDLVLILDAADGDLPAGLKIIEGLDAELSWVWGWVFAQSFADPVSYADAITQEIVARQTAMSGVLQREGKPPLPPVPASLHDTTREPVQRLRTAVKYVRSMVPPVPGGVTLFGLMPLEIADPAAYGGLMRSWCDTRCRSRGAPECVSFCATTWRDRHCSAARESAADAFAAHRFRPAALAAALAREAADETLPVEQRMSATIVAAASTRHMAARRTR